MRTLHKMFGGSVLVSICIVGALIVALLPPGVVGAGSSESGFHISQWTGETWEEIYQHQFQVQYSTEAFAVDVVDGEVALRIVQVGTPFADIDQISLMVDGEELTPEYARYTESGQSIVEDILELDHNVVIAHEQEIEISWDIPAGNDSATVYLTANEYDHGPPMLFPKTGYATYETGSNIGSITVDGLIAETDGPVPLYAPYWQPSSGHPDGYTYVYVCDDEEYVYFSLDVTGDNTNEYGEDWAEITILQPDGSKQAFRIDDYDNTWGESGFGLTSKVTYKHQTYEFAIPKIIIGNENIAFNLAYYGTMAADYYISADIYLDIRIDGDSSEGQVFQVGDTLNITGLVSSEAAIQVYSGDGVADVYSELSVAGPSGPDSDSYSDHDEGTGPDYVQAHIYYKDEWTSLSYSLTDTGLHTITLYSQADLEGQTEHEGYVDESDNAEISLDFYVTSLDECASIANGSFEDADYTGWNLTEYEEQEPLDPECGTFGIAADGETITDGNSTYDFHDALNVTQWSWNLPITYNATNGSYLAYMLSECYQTFRMYQDIELDGSAENLTWDMMYIAAYSELDAVDQYLAVNIRDTGDNILETLFKTTDGVDPYSINMTGFSRDISAYAGQTIRLDIEQRVYISRLDSAFDNFAVVGGTDPLVNGSFETQDYTGWTLMEFHEEPEEPLDPSCGTFGIAEDGQTINSGESTWDFHDGLNVTQSSDGLPITYHATDGDYLAYILVNCPETLTMYQDITLCANATTLTWDMQYTNHAGDFDPYYQYLAVSIRNPSDDSVIETLFKTTQGVDPASMPMTRFSRNISAYAGTTVRLDITQSQYNDYFDSAFDNFAINAPSIGELFMVDCASSQIYELDPSTGTVVNNFSTPVPAGECDGLAYGNGRMFYVCCNATIYEIDPSDGTVISQLEPPLKVAVYAADTAPHTVDVQTKLTSTGLFSQVDVFLVKSGDPVPTLSELQEYDAVLVYSNGQFGNTTAMGDVLADYVDVGGGAVIATFGFSDPAGSYGIGGRISSEGYLPFTQGGWSTGTNLTLVADEPEHPILSGVTSFNGGLSSYFNTVNLTSEADLVAHWSNDVPLIAVQEPMVEGAGRVVGLNFFPLSSDAQSELWDSSTDGDLLMANSLVFAAFGYGYGIDALGFSGDELYALQYEENAIIRVLDPDTGAGITTLEPGIPLVGGLTFAGTRDTLFVSNNGGETTPSFGMTNKGFEAGNFTGWNINEGLYGNASVETSWDSPLGTNYTAASGGWFALLRNGALNESTYISQNFTIDAGDVIQGWAFFSTGEDYGESEFNDQCSVDIMDGATLVDRVFYADTWDIYWPDTPWTYWSWEANSTGAYTLVARVVNIGDGDVPSYVGLDIIEEEPNTIFEIDAETGEVLNSFPAPAGSGYGLYGLGFSSARDTLFLGFEQYAMIYEVDPDTGYVINSFAGPEGAAISALAADECGAVIPQAPEADFHASDITVCANVTIDFFDDSTGTYDSWYWDFGDGSNSTLENPSHAYTNVGNYTVSLTVSGGYGEDTETKTDYIAVLALPEADFHASDTTVCANVTIDFFDDSSGTYDSWYWEFGDGTNSTLESPSHTYTSAGNYTMSLTISNGCGSDTETKVNYIEVLPLPEADFHASDTSPSVNVEIDFFDDSTGTYNSWFWDFGDGTNSSESNPSHNYTSIGNYTVSLTISDGCGSDTETKVDYIEVAPGSEANTATVEAEGSGSPLAVPVDWSWDSNSSTDTTPFDVEDIPDGTELSLTAPATHTQNYTFYVFDHWSVGATDYDPGDVDITFEVNEDLTAIAHYTAVICVDKTLDRCDNGLIGQPGYVVYDPNALPFKTSIYFGMTIRVDTFADGIEDIRVEDGIGADLTVTAISGGSSHYMEYPGKGKKGATKCVWELADMNDGDWASLGISAWTATNPKGKQQYASPGEHTLNSGPKVFFTYDGQDYMLQGPSITVNVVK